MRKLVITSLSGLLLSACSENPEKYRDIKHLEFPPTLAIERTTSTAVKDPALSSTSRASSQTEAPKPSSELDRLIYVGGEDLHPEITLKTRFERAWDLIDHGLKLAEIEVVEKDKEKGLIKVRYEDKNSSSSLMKSVTSMFDISYSDIEYTFTLNKDLGRTTPVKIEKLKQDDPADNAAKSLATVLVDAIKKDLSK